MLHDGQVSDPKEEALRSALVQSGEDPGPMGGLPARVSAGPSEAVGRPTRVAGDANTLTSERPTRGHGRACSAIWRPRGSRGEDHCDDRPVSGLAHHRSDRAALLSAYDTQLRTEAEVARATWTDRDGPLFRARFGQGHGFVTYRELRGFDQPEDGPRLDALIARTLDFFANQTDVLEVEWKTRGHDAPADLGSRLRAHGLIPDERESVMIGAAASLDRRVELPPNVRLRRLGIDADGSHQPTEQVRADLARALTMQASVLGGDAGIDVDGLLPSVLDPAGHLEFWVVEAVNSQVDPTVLCTGRLEVVSGTCLAGLWGGATVPDWRGRGLYRALTAARARSAVARGATLLHSDSTDMSRPMLERSGLVPVTTTTPFRWRRPASEVRLRAVPVSAAARHR